MKLENIDKNLVLSKITEKDIFWKNALENPFSLHGLMFEDGAFRRMPKSIAKKVSESVEYLSGFTAGGRVRFITNSPFVALKVVAPKSFDIMLHMPISGEYGFSIYVDGKYRSFIAPDQFDIVDKDPIFYDGIVHLDGNEHNIEIYFPLYYTISDLLIGLKENCIIKEHPKYKHVNPIVFYGSSITQGGCASHAGNDYIGHLSRWLNADIINLGFSGSALGERVMADYLASLNPSVFVLDYDHNSPTLETLTKTHYNLYLTIRKSSPLTPILFLSKPDFENDKNAKARRDLIRDNYLTAKNNGDKNIYFVDGETLFGTKDRDACTVDGCHPNDLGFYRMAETIYPTLKSILDN